MEDKTLRQKLEETVNKEIVEARFPGIYTLSETTDKPSFSGSIDTRELKTISLSYNPQYETVYPRKTQKVIKDITRHEINHRKYEGFNGCPRTLDFHVKKIAEPISDVIAQKGFTKDDIHYVANALEDTILHDDLHSKFTLDGITGFLQEVGECTEAKTFTPFYEAHVKLNMALWGNKSQKRDVAEYFSRDKKVQEQVRDVLKEFFKEAGIDEFKQEVQEQTIRDKTQIRNYLNNEANWPKISRAYAEAFSKLMTPGYAMPLFNHSGKGTKGREAEKPGAKESEGNEFDKQMETPEYQKGRIQKAYTEGEIIPSWMDKFHALDWLYQGLAQKLNIRAESFTKQAKMPICWYGKRDFNPERDNLKHLTFGLNDSGQVSLKKRKWHGTLEVACKEEPRGFPEARFCLLDTSRSMKYPANSQGVGSQKIIPWGDNSKYHYALLGWYGFLEYLKQNHLLSRMNLSLGNFGNEGQTLITNGLEQAKRLALSPQFSGETHMDADKLSQVFSGKNNLVFTVSDGAIDNWGELKNNFIEQAKKHRYFHLQIGQETGATQDLKNAGLKVVEISDAKDLGKIVIDLTDKLYRGNH